MSSIDRQIKNQICCNSNFKFNCFSCGEIINRGDLITMVINNEGMKLRPRNNGLSFYTPISSPKQWVHIGCIPCKWDNKIKRYINLWTMWDAENEANHYIGVNTLNRVANISMIDRLNLLATKIQSLWRGYIYKQVLPLALEQFRDKQLLKKL